MSNVTVFFFWNVHHPGRSLDPHRAVKHCQVGFGPVQLQPDVAGGGKRQVLFAEEKVEFVVAPLDQSHVSHTLNQVNRGHGAAIGEPFQPRELDDRIGSHAQGAVVFEFDLGDAVTGLQPAVLDNGQVGDRGLETAAIVAVQLHVAFHFAQAHDPYL
jgi:hypothetical protein